MRITRPKWISSTTRPMSNSSTSAEPGEREGGVMAAVVYENRGRHAMIRTCCGVRRRYRCVPMRPRNDGPVIPEEAPMTEMLLFSPMTIRGVELRNRIVVPPMHQYSAVKGFPTDWHLMNAGKFAAGGAGLVVVESTKVERRGCGTVGDLGIWDDKFIEPLGRLVKFIRQQNSVAGIQLGHSGRKARATRPWEGDRPLQRTPDIEDWDAWQPVAPSAIAHSEKWPVPKALARGEVKDLVQAWGAAARRAHEADFDVLELHGAHGYLVHQFLSERANARTDEYGGSEANRMRFITEITEAVRAHWPDHKPLFVRLSVEDNAGWGPEQSVRLAKIRK